MVDNSVYKYHFNAPRGNLSYALPINVTLCQTSFTDEKTDSKQTESFKSIVIKVYCVEKDCDTKRLIYARHGIQLIE